MGQVRFNGFVLDLQTGELRRREHLISLRPLATRCLVTLAGRAGRLVTFDELRRELWGETVVDWRAGLHQAIRQIRCALDDSGHSIVESVPRRGYRIRVRPEPVAIRSRFLRPGMVAAGISTPIALFFIYCVICSLLP